MNPPIYLINLDSSTDRLKKSTQRLSEQGISFERIPAILGSVMTPNELDKHYDAKLNQLQYYTPLTTGQIGCYYSHRKAWKKIADGNYPFGIVLEDDFIMEGDLNLVIKSIEELNFKWDMIKLSAYQNRKRKIKFSHDITNDLSLVVHAKPMSGGAATALTKEAAKQLLNTTKRFGRPSDTDIQHFWEKGIEVLSIMPYAIAQDMNFESTISAKKVVRKKYFWKRKLQQFNTALINRAEVEKQIMKLKKTLGL